MVDSVDVAAELVEEHVASSLLRIHHTIPIGVAGECEGCGYVMQRLIDGQCGFCRDGRLPPDDWEPPSVATQLPREIIAMPIEPSRKIEFTGDALARIEARAAEQDLPFKAAAAELVMQATKPVDHAQPAIRSVDELIDAIQRMFDDRDNSAYLEAAGEQMAAAVVRAEAAEAKLATLRAALG